MPSTPESKQHGIACPPFWDEKAPCARLERCKVVGFPKTTARYP